MQDREAYFDAVYRETYDDLLRYTVIKTGSARDVEDVLQTVYQKFYGRICRKGWADIKQPKAFLVTLAKKELWRTRLRLRSHAPEVALTDGIELDEPSAEETALNRVAAAGVWAVVLSEPLLSYKAFVLYYGFDMPVREVAEALGISEQAVKSRLFRTRALLRRRFGEENRA